MLVDRPGIYQMPAEVYHADPVIEPSLSSSLAKLLIMRTPKHCWTASARLNPNFERAEESKFDIGNAAHSLMLNDVRVFEVVQAEDWRTKDAKAQRDAGRAAGKIPLLHHQLARVQAVVAAGRAQLAVHEDASDAFTDGAPEQTAVWFDEEYGVWCRIRLDWKPRAGNTFDDYKSTAASADPDAWQRIAFALGFDIQAVFYSRGLKALGISERPQFRFVVQEVDEEPFALSVIQLTEGALALAEKKVGKAMSLWARCLRENRWPGYPSKTCFIEAPGWHETQYLDREARDYDRANDAGHFDPLKHQIEWQAPLG